MTKLRAATQQEIEQAELYQLIHRGHPGDVEFYVQMCPETGLEVLELGCGDGRMATALAQAGHRVVAVDLNRGQLALAEKRLEALEPEVAQRVELISADMRHLELEQRFDRVLLPYTTLFALIKDADIARTFGLCRRHLKPGGKLIFDVYNAEELVTEGQQGAEDEAEAEADWLMSEYRGDTLVEVYEREIWKPSLQRFEVHYTYKFDGRGKKRQINQTLVHHYLSCAQLHELLRSQEFAVEATYGDFDLSAWDAESDHVILVATPVVSTEG